MAEIFVLGTSASVAPSSVRERLHVELDDVYSGLGRLTERSHLLLEAVPLSTCGRLELYGVSARPARAIRMLHDIMATRTGFDLDELRAHSYVLHEDEAARHLFRVAAGLDSVVFGEAQILGQVQAAMEHPSTAVFAGSLLTRLFQQSLAAGKRVRAETAIGRGSASVVGAALELLRTEMGSLAGRTAIVVGSGETGTLVARLLRKEGLARLIVVNRTPERAETLASKLGGVAHGLDELPALLATADLIVGSAGESEDLLTAAQLAPVAEAHPRVRFFLDLAHPRNFARDVADVEGARVLDLEQIFERVAAAREARAEQVPLAQAIVDEEVERFATWRRSRQAASVLRGIREQVMAIAESEANRRSRGLGEGEREDLQRFARALARTLLHAPTVAIREADPTSAEGQWLLRSASSLFGVSAGEAEDPTG
ncbi:MAG: glutamyl-tRNA reductase [Gemmatimonadales bacterium]